MIPQGKQFRRRYLIYTHLKFEHSNTESDFFPFLIEHNVNGHGYFNG